MKVTVKKKIPDNAIAVAIETEFIKLESAMKFANAAETGGMAKAAIQDGQVKVNGETCTMRGKKLYPGDMFSFMGSIYRICSYGTE